MILYFGLLMIIRKKNKKTTNIKPVDLDLQLIYKCPNCNLEHWLSLQQSQTKGFKVVCDCATIFQVKRIKNIDIIFEEKPKQELVEQQTTVAEEVEVIEKSVPDTLMNQCKPVLKTYGFTDKEASELIKSTYQNYQCEDIGKFVKFCFSNIGSI